MKKDNKNEVQELMKWWDTYSQKTINIKSKNYSFDLKILKTRLPHLLGIHYIKNSTANEISGFKLITEIKEKNLTNKEIFEKILKNNNKKTLNNVKNRIFNFKNFMENLENAEIVKNTSNNMPEIKHFIVALNENNKYLMLGIGNNGKENYIGTFILDNDRYFRGSKRERVEKIYRYKHSKSEEKIAFSFDNKKLENEKKKILQKVRQNGWELEKLDIGYSNDKEIILEAIKQDGMVLSIVKDNFQKDKETVLTAVKQNGLALKFASDNIRSNKETVLEAVKQNVSALQYATDKLKNNKEFIGEIIKQNPEEFVLQYAGEDVRNDREIVLTAVKNNGMQLAFANEELRKDREIVLEAVKENGLALEFADKPLKEDAQILFEAILQNPDVADKYSIEKIVDNKAETKSEKLDIKER